MALNLVKVDGGKDTTGTAYLDVWGVVAVDVLEGIECV